MQKITPLPKPPSTQDAQNFDLRADIFLGALPPFAKELNALAGELNALPKELSEHSEGLKSDLRDEAQKESRAGIEAIKEAQARALFEIEHTGRATALLRSRFLSVECAFLRLSQAVQGLKNRVQRDAGECARIGEYRLFLRPALPKGYAPLGSLLSKKEYPLAYLYFKGIQALTKEAPEGYFYLPRAGIFARGTGERELVGSYEGDAIRNITGVFSGVDITHEITRGAFRTYGRFDASLKGGGSDNWGRYTDFDASRVIPTASENRPKSNRYLEGIYVGIPQKHI